jgi:maltoporin
MACVRNTTGLSFSTHHNEEISMKRAPSLLPLAAALLGCGVLSAAAHAQDAAAAADPVNALSQKAENATGLEFSGYARGGFYGASGDAPKGGYSLGGDLQKFRLGNEGDNNLEFGIGKRFALGNGAQWGVHFMPQVYNGDYRTAQAYTTFSGLGFAPSLTFWAGQRYRRLADIHVVDHFLMEDGDNYGAGVDGIPLGGLGTLNVALHSSDSIENKAGNPNNARRLNLQWKDIPVNPGGTLAVTAGVIRGDFALGSDGGAIGVMHKQKDFLATGLNNAFFLQASTGHAALSGKFYNLDSRSTESGVTPGAPGAFAPVTTITTDTPQQGAKQRRIANAVDFQFGRLGGQALVGYQTLRPDSGSEVRDWSLGGRLSYGVTEQIKLLGELGTTRRQVEGAARQTLNKGTLAVAWSPNNTFWNRPEFRIYATRVQWNEAAMRANAGSFGADGRRSSTLVGVQLEAWWD